MFVVTVIGISAFALIIALMIKSMWDPEPQSNNIELKPIGKYLSDFEVVGVHVKERKWYIINHVVVNNPVTLVVEPDNPHSSEAIMVLVNDIHVGYIAERDLEEVHEILKNQYIGRVIYKDYSESFLTLKIEINHP